MLLLVGITAASLAVWSLIFLRWQNGQPALPFRERTPVAIHGTMVLTAGLIWFGMRAVAGFFAVTSDASVLRNVQLSCLSNGLTALTVWPLMNAFYGTELNSLGLRLKESMEEIRVGAFACIAAFLPVLIVLIATSAFRDPSLQHPFLRLIQNDQGIETILWIDIAVTLFAPLTEELLFRVILQGSLQTRVSPVSAIVVTAVVFSAIHGWPDSLGLFPLALILGYVFYRRNSYLAVVVLHALFNLVNLLMALMSV